MTKVTGTFQTTHEPGSALCDGKIWAEVFENTPTDLKPTYIISTEQPWHIKVGWEITGTEVPMYGGTWHLKAHLEKIGPGDDKTHPDPPYDIALDGGTTYSKKIEFDAGKVPEGEYDLVVVLTYEDVNDDPGPLAGNVRLPMLQFYVP